MRISLQVKPAHRKEVLDDQRHLKMASSAHAYVRGNTIRFYEWLSKGNAPASLPSGPPIWICGDCHVGNLGPVANLDGQVEIQIRDLDQTVIGNPAHDLLRLGLSLAMAARSSDLPGVTTAFMLEAMIDGYLGELSSRHKKPDVNQIAPIQKVMQEAFNRKWKHLAEERIEDVTPTIPLGKRFWSLTGDEREHLRKFFEGEKARKLVQCLHQCDEGQPIQMLDAAYWMKGCSSLGRLRYAVLVGVGKKNRHGFRMIDIKEATRAAAPTAPNVEMPANNAERVVAGALALSPFLGERMLSSTFAGRQVVVRELRPQDMKFELAALTQQEAILSARLFASVVGKAHARQMSPDVRQAWAKQIKSRHSRGLEAPGWLWTSVVSLVADHEASYLEHCRQYALSRVG
ncbi:DUF2252 family protein [Terriglobus saanensis]|uniref:DUF2252 domain-containing protein n=1 Tax=Terriglobus saanensis (strain ATCC BAA-1853 / DSM 23119 / SP1PR4) TaxID=401053 RepID=E8V661_TERSS|nr:DUF2252 family protein [Terriglobus saanensis]ADV84952.1 Protein of unknown function DUF2252 [Terriglobus saanensis SP1PR4]